MDKKEQVELFRQMVVDAWGSIVLGDIYSADSIETVTQKIIGFALATVMISETLGDKKSKQELLKALRTAEAKYEKGE